MGVGPLFVASNRIHCLICWWVIICGSQPYTWLSPGLGLYVRHTWLRLGSVRYHWCFQAVLIAGDDVCTSFGTVILIYEVIWHCNCVVVYEICHSTLYTTLCSSYYTTALCDMASDILELSQGLSVGGMKNHYGTTQLNTWHQITANYAVNCRIISSTKHGHPISVSFLYADKFSNFIFCLTMIFRVYSAHIERGEAFMYHFIKYISPNLSIVGLGDALKLY